MDERRAIKTLLRP